MTPLELRELDSIEEFDEARRLFADIWQPGPGADPVSTEMMRALSHAGNYVAGAYENGRMVGASVAFLGEPAGTSLHSHITGTAAGRGIGLALKLHQREWALARGLSRITWTYDPLVRRNAYFNLVKLGARPEEYLRSFYGTMADAINDGDETDRVLVAWHLNEPQVVAAAEGRSEPIVLPPDTSFGVLDKDGRPELGPAEAPTVLVAVPQDIEALRGQDQEAARAWRLAVRQVLGDLLAEGAVVVGFHDRSCYVVDRAPTSVRPDLPMGSRTA